VLIQGIQGALFKQEHSQTTPNSTREPVVHMLVSSKNKISWHHLLKGRFSKQWTQIQGRHILEDPELDHEKQSGSRWLKLALHHLWTLTVWQVWLQRPVQIFKFLLLSKAQKVQLRSSQPLSSSFLF
jgi:hypothetical protein